MHRKSNPNAAFDPGEPPKPYVVPESRRRRDLAPGPLRPRHVAADAAFFRIPAATANFGLSRSELYRLLGTGKIKAVKSGKALLIIGDTLRAHVAALPFASIRAPKAP